jgi:hypothetical protein
MNEPIPRKSFGRSQAAAPVTQAADPDALDFTALRGGPADAPDFPRWMLPILAVTIIGILLGAFYFIHVTLAFKTAIMLNVTDIYSPYPDNAVIYVMIPAFCGPFYCLIDFLRLKTGISPRSPAGIAGIFVLFVALGALALLPISVIRHHTVAYAAAHGYTKCSNQFDPQHIKVYALKNYVEAYGCPTYTVGQPQN